MLFDLIASLTTPAPLAHRRLGCVGDSVRTASRERRCRAAWAPHLDATRAAIREAHLAALGALEARVCLVSDLDEIEEDRGGHVLERIDLLYGVTLPEPERSWLWQLAPFGEAARDRRLVHRVAAFPDWKP